MVNLHVLPNNMMKSKYWVEWTGMESSSSLLSSEMLNILNDAEWRVHDAIFNLNTRGRFMQFISHKILIYNMDKVWCVHLIRKCCILFLVCRYCHFPVPFKSIQANNFDINVIWRTLKYLTLCLSLSACILQHNNRFASIRSQYYSKKAKRLVKSCKRMRWVSEWRQQRMWHTEITDK